MLEHLKIFGIIVNLSFAIWLAIYIFQIYRRYEYTFLKSISTYTGLFTCAYSLILIDLYISTNVPEYNSLFLNQIGTSIGNLSITIIVLGMLYYSFEFVREFLNKKVPKVITLSILAIISTIILINIIRLILPSTNNFLKYVDYFRYFVIENILLIEPFIYLYYLLNRKKVQDTDYRNLGSTFVILYLLKFLLFIVLVIINVLFNFEGFFEVAIGFLTLLIFNLVPLLWIRLIFYPYINKMSNLFGDEINFDDFIKTNKISKREFEIIKLLFDGRTNSEIAKGLFISYSTVKNHIYNIYQKIGISTRYELYHEIQKYNKGKGL